MYEKLIKDKNKRFKSMLIIHSILNGGNEHKYLNYHESFEEIYCMYVL